MARKKSERKEKTRLFQVDWTATGQTMVRAASQEEAEDIFELESLAKEKDITEVTVVNTL